MRYQVVRSKIWNDENFINLSPLQQRLFLYLLTCPHGNFIGLFVLKESWVIGDLRYGTIKDYKKDLAGLSHFILYDDKISLIWIKNLLKYEMRGHPLNSKQKAGAVILIDDLPKSPLIMDFIKYYENILGEMPIGVSIGVSNGVSNPYRYTDTDTDTDTDTELNTFVENDFLKIAFDSSKGEFSFIHNTHLTKWKEAYPALDVSQEIRKAEAWLLANPKNRKSNYARFLTNWLSRAQDKAPAFQRGRDTSLRTVPERKEPPPPTEEEIEQAKKWYEDFRKRNYIDME